MCPSGLRSTPAKGIRSCAFVGSNPTVSEIIKKQNKQRKLVMQNKKNQLGMNPSTASNRLIKDLLFDFVIKAGHKCHRCGGDLERHTISIEHIEAWLDSDHPIEMFFDIQNIAYSHLSCNARASRPGIRPKRGMTHGTSGYRQGCRCEKCKSLYSINRRERHIKSKKYNLRSSNGRT